MVSPERKSAGVRSLLLEPPAFVIMGALWRGEPSPIVQATIAGVRAYALKRWPDFTCKDETA
jgi:hypothetical protein